jgi:hypothetical protein
VLGVLALSYVCARFGESEVETLRGLVIDVELVFVVLYSAAHRILTLHDLNLNFSIQLFVRLLIKST